MKYLFTSLVFLFTFSYQSSLLAHNSSYEDYDTGYESVGLTYEQDIIMFQDKLSEFFLSNNSNSTVDCFLAKSTQHEINEYQYLVLNYIQYLEPKIQNPQFTSYNTTSILLKLQNLYQYLNHIEVMNVSLEIKMTNSNCMSL